MGLACRVQDLRAPGVAQRLNALRQYVLATRPVTPPPAGTQQSAAALDGITTATIDTALTRHAELQTLTGFGRDLRTLEQFAQGRSSGTSRLRRRTCSSGRARSSGCGRRARRRRRRPPPSSGRFRQSFDTFVLNGVKRSDASLETMMETDECRDRLHVEIDQVRARYN